MRHLRQNLTVKLIKPNDLKVCAHLCQRGGVTEEKE